MTGFSAVELAQLTSPDAQVGNTDADDIPAAPDAAAFRVRETKRKKGVAIDIREYKQNIQDEN